MSKEASDQEIVIESKWPNGVMVTTIIRDDHVEELVEYPPAGTGLGGKLTARTRPLTELEARLRSL